MRPRARAMVPGGGGAPPADPHLIPVIERPSMGDRCPSSMMRKIRAAALRPSVWSPMSAKAVPRPSGGRGGERVRDGGEGGGKGEGGGDGEGCGSERVK